MVQSSNPAAVTAMSRAELRVCREAPKPRGFRQTEGKVWMLTKGQPEGNTSVSLSMFCSVLFVLLMDNNSFSSSFGP